MAPPFPPHVGSSRSVDASSSSSGSRSGSRSGSTSTGGRGGGDTLDFDKGIVAGKYEILTRIGKGGMGAVYEARHVTTQRIVALKTLTTVAATDEASADANRDSLSRFSREARVIGQIRSEHVVEIYDAGVTDDEMPFIAMERLHGEDLQSLGRRFETLPPETVIRLGIQAARGLAAAHAVGVIHRDIKPANLFLTTIGDRHVLKILDFGVARVVSGSPVDLTQDLTRTGSLLGSPLYMSPEQIRGSHEVDGRTDVWSLGVSLYRLLAGRTPKVKTKGLGELLIAICCEPAVPLTTAAPWVPRELSALIDKSLAIGLDQRLASAQDFADALTTLLEGRPVEIGVNDLRAVTPEEKNVVVAPESPASASSPEGESPGGSTHNQIAVSAPARKPHARMRPALALVGALLSIAALGVGAIVLRTPANRSASPGAASAELPAESAAPAPARVVEIHSMRLAVPVGASIQVDGVAVPHEDDDAGVFIRGALGTSHRVRVTDGTRVVETRVVLSDRGPIPAAIEFPPDPSARVAPVASSASPRAAAPSAPSGQAAPAAARAPAAAKSAAPPSKPKGAYADWE